LTGHPRAGQPTCHAAKGTGWQIANPFPLFFIFAKLDSLVYQSTSKDKTAGFHRLPRPVNLPRRPAMLGFFRIKDENLFIFRRGFCCFGRTQSCNCEHSSKGCEFFELAVCILLHASRLQLYRVVSKKHIEYILVCITL